MTNETVNNDSSLSSAGLVGKSIVKCDCERCTSCSNESFDCVKLTMPGGQVCLW